MTNTLLKEFFGEIKKVPPILQCAYYPSLNGLRGIAILMVVVSHLKLTSGFFYDAIFNGALGVIIFFVLSGFLITTLCIKEKVLTQGLSLKNFYVRRVLRILPVAYLYILVILLLNAIFKLQVHYLSIVGASLFLMDISSYFRKYYFSWYTGHYWSLAVEEQFYLVFPLLLKKNFSLYLLVLLFIVFALPVIICLQNFYLAFNTGAFYSLTHMLVKFQAIAVGCLFSILLFKYQLHNTVIFKNKTIVNILALLLIIFIRYNDFFTLQSMFSGLAISFLTGYIIITNITPGTDLIFMVLNSRALKTIGILSYSIYIWQQLFTSNEQKFSRFIVSYPYNVIWIMIVSMLSYYFYERYFLKFKIKFAGIKDSVQ